MKRLLAILLSLAIVLFLCACRSDSTQSNLKNSKEQAEGIYDIQDNKYNEAESLIEEGKLGLAAISFWNLEDYRDARQRSIELWRIVANRKTLVAGGWHTVGVKDDGTVVAVGSNDLKQSSVSKWSDVVSVDASCFRTIGLKSDGTVVSVGQSDVGQNDVSKWRNIVAVAAGDDCTLGLKDDGTVFYAGDYYRANPSDFTKWTSIVSISAGGAKEGYLVGLKEDGTVLVQEDDLAAYTAEEWTDIVMVDSSNNHIVGLKADGTVVAASRSSDAEECDVSDWRDIVGIAAGYHCTAGLKSDGTVVVIGNDDFDDCSNWTNIIEISIGHHHIVGLKSDGTVVVTGYRNNEEGEFNVQNWQGIKLPK